MYKYFFKRMLGDVSVRNEFDYNENIDVFSSSYSSGQTGLTILNKSGEKKNVAVNLEHFSYGSQYYWYTLTPGSGNLYDRKVRVNGETNPDYDAGGPLNYDQIKAYSATLTEGIRLELPPYSTTYVLVSPGSSSAVSLQVSIAKLLSSSS